MLCCGYTLTDFRISIRLTSLALWKSNDCPSASKATLMNMDKYFMWIHYERLHNHNKAKHNKTMCIFLGIYCITRSCLPLRKISSLKRNLLSNIPFARCYSHMAPVRGRGTITCIHAGMLGLSYMEIHTVNIYFCLNEEINPNVDQIINILFSDLNTYHWIFIVILDNGPTILTFYFAFL